MLTGKQRSYLRSLTNTLEPVLIIGKNGVTENVIKQLDDLLEARELIKIKLLDNSGLSAKEVASEVCDILKSQYVQSIGSKFTIYRESKEPLINIPK
ncbi:ribosome assembly RNA-binding protein YhbY [Sedimentibacter sp. zth1]|uniref:ribosome assembly RNA-binding protein YhbY n=1 Tax=Sedimentibacter sp. zth1 TaxID=2816908 RepID=UPI001A9246F2|nr:ribosome assembly RNA-binding protein YhbY [Sedimentibacter sp. zth1]QSX06357.1 ribosome assembly RNA-binding protein YhbY [Sedimentibacter sp. zth1]